MRKQGRKENALDKKLPKFNHDLRPDDSNRKDSERGRKKNKYKEVNRFTSHSFIPFLFLSPTRDPHEKKRSNDRQRSTKTHT